MKSSEYEDMLIKEEERERMEKEENLSITVGGGQLSFGHLSPRDEQMLIHHRFSQSDGLYKNVNLRNSTGMLIQ